MIQNTFPEEFALRDQDKYHYRYPGGEVSVFSFSVGLLVYLDIWVHVGRSDYFKRLSFLVVIYGPGSATGTCHYGA